MSKDIESAVCPICNGPNNCGEIDPGNLVEGRCWCATANFPSEIFKLVPNDKLNKACICKSCLDRFNKGELHSNPTKSAKKA